MLGGLLITFQNLIKTSLHKNLGDTIFQNLTTLFPIYHKSVPLIEHVTSSKNEEMRIFLLDQSRYYVGQLIRQLFASLIILGASI